MSSQSRLWTLANSRESGLDTTIQVHTRMITNSHIFIFHVYNVLQHVYIHFKGCLCMNHSIYDGVCVCVCVYTVTNRCFFYSKKQK